MCVKRVCVTDRHWISMDFIDDDDDDDGDGDDDDERKRL